MWIVRSLHRDRGVLEPIEEGAQRAGPSLARNFQRQGLVVPVPGNDTERRIERPRVREPQADVPAGDQTLELIGRALRDQPTVIEQRHAVGELIRLLQVVGREEDRDAPVDEIADDPPHGPAAARVESSGRLVQEDDPRVAHQGHRQIQPATLATGVRDGGSPALLLDVQPPEQLRDAAPALGPAQMVQICHEGQVLLAREEVVHGRRLTGDADHLANGVGLTGGIVSADPDLARVGTDHRRQDLHGRRLAGAVRSEQREDRPLGNAEVDPVHGDRVVEGLPQPDRFECRLGRDGVHRSSLPMLLTEERWTTMSPIEVWARTSTASSPGSGGSAWARSFRTWPNFVSRSNQAGTPSRTPIPTLPNAVWATTVSRDDLVEVHVAIGRLGDDARRREVHGDLAVRRVDASLPRDLADPGVTVRVLDRGSAVDPSDPDRAGRLDVGPARDLVHRHVAEARDEFHGTGPLQDDLPQPRPVPARTEASRAAQGADPGRPAHRRPGGDVDPHIDRPVSARRPHEAPSFRCLHEQAPVRVLDARLPNGRDVRLLRGVARLHVDDRVRTVARDDADVTDAELQGQCDRLGRIERWHRSSS